MLPAATRPGNGCSGLTRAGRCARIDPAASRKQRSAARRPGIDGFLTFVRRELAIGRRGSQRQLAFFRLEDAEARRFIERRSRVIPRF